MAKLAWMRASKPWPLILAAALSAFASPALSAQFETLKKLIVDHKVESIEELLPLLPADFRSRYALMFRSRSLQGGTYKEPRVILYGRDARFVITFSGNPRERGFDALETMEFDEETKAFRLREVVFPRESRGAVAFSEVNPDKCSKCHGSPAKPVWDTFPTWPGAYGENYRAHLSAEENAGLRSFLDGQPTHPRYRFLTHIDRIVSREAFYSSAQTRYQGSEQEPPNAELGTLLGNLNFQRIAREVESRSQFAAYKYVLLAALSAGCGDIRDFLPDESRAAFENGYGRFLRAADDAAHEQARTKRHREISGAGDRSARVPTFADDDSVNKFRFIVEKGLGLQTQRWSLALEQETYDFSTTSSFMSGLAPLLLNEVSVADPPIRDLSHYRTFTPDDRYCRFLRLRSRQSLHEVAFDVARDAHPGRAVHDLEATARRVPEPAAPSVKGEEEIALAARAIPRPPLLERCVTCHASAAAPYLPFADPAQLARRLHGTHYPRGSLLDEIRFRLSPEAGSGRMPLDANTSESERDDIETYFQSLFRLYPAADPMEAAPSILR